MNTRSAKASAKAAGAPSDLDSRNNTKEDDPNPKVVKTEGESVAGDLQEPQRSLETSEGRLERIENQMAEMRSFVEAIARANMQDGAAPRTAGGETSSRPDSRADQVHGESNPREQLSARVQTRRPTGPVQLSHLPREGAYGLIVGRQDLFKVKLDDVSDLYVVAKHFKEFRSHQRTHGDDSQAFSTTMSSRAIVDLRLEETRVDAWPVEQWRRTLAAHLMETRGWLEDTLDALARVPLEGCMKSTRSPREYHTANCRAVLRYLHTIEDYREACHRLNGVDATMAKPEASLVEAGPSTIMEIVADKIKAIIPEFYPIVTDRIRFRLMTDWSQQYAAMCENLSSATVTYHEHRRMFSVYDSIARSQPKRDERQRQEASYNAAKTRIFADRGQGQGKQLFQVPPSKGSFQRQTAISAIIDSDDYVTAQEEESTETEDDAATTEDEDNQDIMAAISAQGGGDSTKGACYPNLLGKCPRGADCPHSHKKEDAAEYIKMLTHNLNNRQWLPSGLSPSISALVSESAPGNALRIRVNVNGHSAVALLDTGNDLPTCVSQRFVDLHAIPTHGIKPIAADLAGTGTRKVLTKGVKLSIQTTLPATKECQVTAIDACVFPTSRDDIIVGIRDIVDHFIPLTAQLLLEARGYDKNGKLRKAFTGLAGDVYAISAISMRDPDQANDVDTQSETDNDEPPELLQLDEVNESRNNFRHINTAAYARAMQARDTNRTDITYINTGADWADNLSRFTPEALATARQRQADSDEQHQLACEAIGPIRWPSLDPSKTVVGLTPDAILGQRIKAAGDSESDSEEELPSQVPRAIQPQEDSDDDDQPPLVPLRYYRSTVFMNAISTDGAQDAAPNSSTAREDRQAREPPVQGRIYEPLDKVEEAPEEREFRPASLFGQAEAEAMDTLYNTEEAYAKRVETYKQAAPDAVKEKMGAFRDKLIEFLCTTDGDAMKAHTHRHWHGLRIDPVHIEFLETLPPSVFQKARPVPGHLLPKIKELIGKLTDQGYLQYSMYGNYASPTLYVLKSDGVSLRMCNDLRRINQYIKYSPVPQPHIHASLQMLHGFKLFAELDWSTAYHQIPLDDETSNRLAMNTPIGIYKPRFCPEGVKVGSALMMGVVYAIFSKFGEWLIPIHDNLLIAAHDPEDLFDKVRMVYKECAEVGVQLNILKCQFGVEKLAFFGYIVEPGLYYVDKERLEDIRNIPFPKSKKAVQKYLGMAVFCSPFIPHFVDAFAKIYEMSTDSFSFSPGDWGDTDYVEEFSKSKDYLKRSAAVHFPDRSLEWVLRTDASQVAIGGVLLQMMKLEDLSKEQQDQARAENLVREDNTVAAPIAFISKKFTDPATRWTVTEQELFAIIHCLKKTEHIISTKRIIIETDHMNLVSLSEGAIAASPRCVRWRQYLAQFDYVIRHIAGVRNILADYLSRHIYTPDPVVAALSYLVDDELADQAQWLAQLSTEEAVAGISAIMEAAPRSILEIITSVHVDRNGHRGARTTWEKVKQFYPNARVTFEDVNRFVQDCGTCAKIRDPFQDPHTAVKALPVYHARAVTNVDVTTITTDKFGMRYIFVFVNAFTKYTLLYPSKDKEAKSVATAMLQHAAVVGITDCMWSDNGTEFCAEVTQEMAKILGAHWTYTLTYRPQANGIVERQNKEILDRIRVLLTFKDTWNVWSAPHVISLVQLSLNTTVHGSTGQTPCTLTFGETSRQYMRSPSALRKSENADLMDFNQALDNVREAAKTKIIASQLPRLRKQPETRITYEPTDLVLRNPRRDTGAVGMRKNKLEPTNLGPYEVIRQERSVDGASNTVVVREVNDRSVQHEFHASTLRLFTGQMGMDAEQRMQLAKELAQLDNLEYTIIKVVSMQGNTAKRDDLVVMMELEDGSVDQMPYTQAIHTEAFTEYCERITIGRVLSMTRDEMTQFVKEQTPAKNQSVRQFIATWPDEKQIHLDDRRYLTAHWFNTMAWHIYTAPDTIAKEARNREPMLECIVVKFTTKSVDLEIPVFARTGSRTKRFIVAFSLPKLLLYTAREEELRHDSVIMTEELMSKSTLREELYAASGF